MALAFEWIQIFAIKIDIKWADYLPVQGALQELRPGSSTAASVVSGVVVLLWSGCVLMIGMYYFARKKDFL